MQPYTDVVQDRFGNVIANATVTVTDAATGSTSTVYSSNAVGTNVNPLTTDINGRFSFYGKDGSYYLTVTKTGLTTAVRGPVTIATATQYANVDGYGAAGDGSTDDTTAIQAAEDALTTNGGVLVFTAGKNYLFNSQLTLKPGVTWTGYGATLTWGGSTTVAITSPTTGVLDRFGIYGLKISAGTASKALELFSPYQFRLQDLRIDGNSATDILIDVGVNTSGGTNSEGNRNAAYGMLSNVLQTGTSGTMVRLKGGSSSSQVVTLVTLENVTGSSVAVRGVDIAKWADTIAFSGFNRFSLAAISAVGVELNSDTPGSDLGVYGVSLGHLGIDCFSSFSGRIGVKMGYAKEIVAKLLEEDPACEGGVFTSTVNSYYDFNVAVAGTSYTRRYMDVLTARLQAQGQGIPYVLAKTGTAVTAPTDTSTDTLATVTVPAGAIGANGMVRIKAHFNAATGTTNRTLVIAFGGTAMLTKILASEVDMMLDLVIVNQNATAVQEGIPTFTTTNGIQLLTVTGATKDTTAAQDITFKITKATGSDPCILKAYSVELVSDGT
jgi:hypothetical protein